MTHDLIATDRLTKRFGSGHTAVDAVKEVSLKVKPGELVLIMGPSGSGKTTLLSMIGGLLQPTAGQIHIDGVEITAIAASRLPELRARRIGFVFQAFNLLEALTVEENILFPARLVPGGVRDARDRANQLIQRLGLEKRRRALPKTLSGGEKQRVAVARALINQPPLILADEPTGNLDSHSGQEVMMVLHDIARDENRSVVMVTHDPRVEEIADRILWLEDGALRDRKSEHHEWVHDPVCGMRVDAWSSTLHTEFEGKTFHFCSERCHERFTGNPLAYLSNSDSPSPTS